MGSDLKNKILSNYRYVIEAPFVIENNEGFFCPYCNRILGINNCWNIQYCSNPNCSENVKKEKDIKKEILDLRIILNDTNNKIEKLNNELKHHLIKNGCKTKDTIEQEEYNLNKELENLNSVKKLLEN